MTEAQEAALMACYDDFISRRITNNGSGNGHANEERAAHALVERLKAHGLFSDPIWTIVEWASLDCRQLGAGDLMRRSRARFQEALGSHMAGEAAEAAP